MTDQEKRNYNKEHYQKNREYILKRVKGKYKPKKHTNSNIIPIFRSLPKIRRPPGVNNSRFKPREWNWTTLFLLIFVAAMTGFLVHEMAQFYSSAEGTQNAAYLKALILEGAIFAFTLIKARSFCLGVVYRTMIILIYCYSTWAVSSSVIHNANYQRNQIDFHQKFITELESEIHQRGEMRNTLFGSKRITLALKIDKTLETLKSKLAENRENLMKLPPVTDVWNTLLTLVIFRILVMITNLFCLMELGRRYRLKLK